MSVLVFVPSHNRSNVHVKHQSLLAGHSQGGRLKVPQEKITPVPGWDEMGGPN